MKSWRVQGHSDDDIQLSKQLEGRSTPPEYKTETPSDVKKRSLDSSRVIQSSCISFVFGALDPPVPFSLRSTYHLSVNWS